MATNRFARSCFFCFASLAYLVCVSTLTAQTKSSTDTRSSKASLPPTGAVVTDIAASKCIPLDACPLLLTIRHNHHEIAGGGCHETGE